MGMFCITLNFSKILVKPKSCGLRRLIILENNIQQIVLNFANCELREILVMLHMLVTIINIPISTIISSKKCSSDKVRTREVPIKLKGVLNLII